MKIAGIVRCNASMVFKRGCHVCIATLDTSHDVLFVQDKGKYESYPRIARAGKSNQQTPCEIARLIVNLAPNSYYATE